MAHYSNSFLPSGGVEYRSPGDPSSRSSSAISPLSAPRRFHTSGLMSPTHINNPAAQGKPLSPPVSRSPSAEHASGAMLEDWRTYTANLRNQFKGERAHLAADRARMEECMEEERHLWELERSYFVAQVAELEAKLAKERQRADSFERRLQGVTSQPMSTSSSSSGAIPKTSAFASRTFSASSHESAHSVPQESGRDANGSPFYAPAPRNPRRTFGTTEASSIRLDSISSATESVIQVANRELKPSDFQKPAPGSGTISPSPSIPASIDISLIQPGLEGVSIKASAVHPVFAAKVLSPVISPDKAPARPEPITLDEAPSQHRRSTTSPEGREIKTLEVVSAPENRRLTMNAGHTPNHSISKLPWLNEDGDATPRQPVIFKGAIDRRASMALSLSSAADDGDADEEDGDKELSGQLGLTNDFATDNPFLAALTEKLEEVQRSQPASPSESGSHTSLESKKEDDEEDDDDDDGPRLRLRPSINFGRPMGSM